MTIAAHDSFGLAADVDRTLDHLRSLRNAVIGSRTRKGQIVVEGRVPELIACLVTPLEQAKAWELRCISATILGSLAQSASPPTLLVLLRADLPRALMAVLADVAAMCQSSGASDDVLRILESLLRPMRSLSAALAKEVAPDHRMGLGPARAGFGKSASMIRPRSSRDAAAHSAAERLQPSRERGIGPETYALPHGQSFDRSSTAEDPQQELVYLSRAAIAQMFSEGTLPLLLGTLFLGHVTRHQRINQTLSEAKAARHPSLAGPLSAQLETSENQASSSSALDPSAVERGRMSTVIEMVTGSLASCLSIPGLESDEGGFADQGPSRGAAENDASPLPSSPDHQIRLRRRAIINFNAAQSPYSQAADIIDERGTTSVLAKLLEAAECGFHKTQEAALWMLAELTRSNSETSVRLFKCQTPSGLLPTSMLLSLHKDPNVYVRLAAFCCLANIIKVHPFTPKTNERVLAVLVELLDCPGEVQTTAAFALARVVADDSRLQDVACGRDYQCIKKLGVLLERTSSSSATSRGKTLAGALPATEPALHHLQEAVLTALAALTFSRDELRRQVMESTSPNLLRLVIASLSSTSLGTRVAACRLVRALSRSVSILRTSLVDAGVAERLLAMLKSSREDAEVQTEATAAICNLVLSFAPMRQMLLENGGLDRIVALCGSEHGLSRLNALWALKNVTYGSETAFKRELMIKLGYARLAALAFSSGTSPSDRAGDIGSLQSQDENSLALQEQALNIIRNLASARREDIEMTLEGFGGSDTFFDLVEATIWQGQQSGVDRSTTEAIEQSPHNAELVVEQAAYIIVNVATGGKEHRRAILNRPNLVDAICFFARHSRSEVRVAALWAVMNLTQTVARSAATTTVRPAAAAPSISGGSAGEERMEEDSNGVNADADADDADTSDIAAEAVSKLRRFGFVERLQELKEDPERDVSDRARALWARFAIP